MASLEKRVQELELQAGMNERRLLVVDPAMSEAEVQAMVDEDRKRTGHRGDYLLINTGVPWHRA
jgi:hypothetical protein